MFGDRFITEDRARLGVLFGADDLRARFVIDIVADVDNDVYNEARSKVISAKEDAEPGAVFGYEAVTEHRAMFNQQVWSFQGYLPVVLSRLTITLPSGWR